MGELVNLLNTAGGAFVAFAGHMLIQSSVLIVILAALDLVLRKRVKAVVRYWIWLLILAKLLLPPSLSSPTSLVSWVGSRLPETTLVSLVPESPVVTPEAMSGAAPTPVDAAPRPQAAEGPVSEAAPLSTAPIRPVVLPTWQALVLLAWMAAVLLMGVLLIQRVAFVHGLMAQAQEAPDALRALLEQCRRQMALRGSVGIRLTCLSVSPSVCGLLRPVILMPEPMIRQLGTPQLRSVLLHELAHLQRGDLWINLLQTLLQIVYLYHPLLWLANARIRAVREQAVDETVLAALGEEAEEYPRTLLCISKLAFGRPALSLRLLGVVESEKALTTRIRHMVSRPFPQNARLGLLGLATIVVAALVLLPMARGTETGQNGTSKFIDRLQKEDDPELGELIRTAVANHQGAGEKEILEITRRVTQGHAQVLLLDQQIEEVARQIEATPGPAETRRQLLQTKKELESKRMAEMGNLREAMGIIPRLPFEKQAVETLNTWLRLNVVGERVYVVDTLKPFVDNWAVERWKVAGLLSEKETLDCVRGRLKDKSNLPIRIDIYFKSETKTVAERLRDAIMSLAREANADMDTEVRVELSVWVGTGESTFFLREGKIRTLYPGPVRRPDGGPKLLASGLVDPNDLEQSILWRLTKPKNVPLRFRVEYDEASAKLAKQIADTAKAVAKRLGIGELVEVTGALVEPVPEVVFLGRWQAITKGEIQAMDVQPGGICLLTTREGSEATKGGVTVSCPWVPTTKEIIVDVAKGQIINGKWFAYQGSVNSEGDLVVGQAGIYPQGSIHPSSAQPMIFKKVQ
jgi:beta-lactamase regulating signal transducer with metallopeptidase domain/uncharacterized Zn-binding protein involved in type VI secretion